MKKQNLANLAIAAIFLIAGNLTAQPRNKHKEPWELEPGKGAPAPVKPGTARSPEVGPKQRQALQPATQRPTQQPAPAVRPNTTKPMPAMRPEPVKPSTAPHPGPKPGAAPTARPTPNHGAGAPPIAAGPHSGPGPKPGPVVNPGPGPKPGPAVHPGPGPKPGPAVHPGPGPKPGPVVHPGPGHHPGPVVHHDKPHDHGFFHRLFEPAPPRPHGFRTFPHRHPTSKFTFLWYDYLPGGQVYEIKDYVIYECRYCHLVHYSPIIPPNQLCPAVPGQIHSYQILGYYGDFAFRCATCGVTINSNAVPNVGYCGAQYHIWQQLLEY